MLLQFEKLWRTMLLWKIPFFSLLQKLFPKWQGLCLSRVFLWPFYHVFTCLNLSHSLLTRSCSRFCLLDPSAHNHGLPLGQATFSYHADHGSPLYGSFWLHSHSPFHLSPHHSQTGLPEIEIWSRPLLDKTSKDPKDLMIKCSNFNVV